jgi:hypothetical protein
MPPLHGQVHVIRQKRELYRVRLSQDVLSELQWPAEQEFNCHGFFRFPGELLCAAASVKNADGTHPFDAVLRFRQLPLPKNIHAVSAIPPASVLTAGYRVFDFPAKWTSESRTQLHLQIGIEATKRLGWASGTVVPPASVPPLYAMAWSSLLLLMSETRFQAVQEQDFTVWQPPLLDVEDSDSSVLAD